MGEGSGRIRYFLDLGTNSEIVPIGVEITAFYMQKPYDLPAEIIKNGFVGNCVCVKMMNPNDCFGPTDSEETPGNGFMKGYGIKRTGKPYISGNPFVEELQIKKYLMYPGRRVCLRDHVFVPFTYTNTNELN